MYFVTVVFMFCVLTSYTVLGCFVRPCSLLVELGFLYKYIFYFLICRCPNVTISTDCSISIATVEFYSIYFYIFWHFLHISWDVTQNYILSNIFLFLHFQLYNAYISCVRFG
jgi:hypothetical protein